MQQDRFYCQAHRAKSGSRQPILSRLWRRIGLFGAFLTLGGLCCSAPVRSSGDTAPLWGTTTSMVYHIYLYNGDGTSTDVTDYVFYVGGQAYIFPNDPIPVILDYQIGHVYDPYEHVIGFIINTVPPFNGG